MREIGEESEDMLAETFGGVDYNGMLRNSTFGSDLQAILDCTDSMTSKALLEHKQLMEKGQM